MKIIKYRFLGNEKVVLTPLKKPILYDFFLKKVIGIVSDTRKWGTPSKDRKTAQTLRTEPTE